MQALPNSELCSERRLEEVRWRDSAFGDGTLQQCEDLARGRVAVRQSGCERTYLAGPETITKKITKTADATSYWILYYTAVKDQIPDKLKQNIKKNPVQYLISIIGIYSIEANKTEWVCAPANTVLRSGCIETRIPARMSRSTSETAKSRRKQKG